MSRIVIHLLSAIVVLLLLLLGVVLFIFSDTGNAFLSPYIKTEIEKATGMPVTIEKFTLRPGKATLYIRLNRELRFRAVSNYNLVKRSFVGAYVLGAKKFTYEGITLSNIKINGKFRGTTDAIHLNGKGHALRAPLAYKVDIEKGEPKSIEALVKGISLAELLVLAKQPPLVSGKADLSIHMPNIGTKGAKGTATLRVKDAYFRQAFIQKRYGYVLPPKSRVSLHADATLEGDSVGFDAKVQSNLLNFTLTEGRVNTRTKSLYAKYDVVCKEMRVITANKLAGAFSAAGTIVAKDNTVHLHGKSHSLGGTLSFDLGKQVHIAMVSLSVAKLLKLSRQPALLTGNLDGTINLDDTSLHSGKYLLDITKGSIDAKTVQRLWKRKVPPHNRLSIHSEGSLQKGLLLSKTALHSTLANLTLNKLRYETTSQTLSTNYALRLHDIAFLGAKLHKSLEAEGKLHYHKRVSVSGVVKGLGERVAFHYSGVKANIDAVGVYVQRLLALAGYPEALRGKLNIKADITNLSTFDGSLHIKGKNLTTQPKAMQTLMGKALKMDIGLLQLEATMKQGKAEAKGLLQSSLGTLRLHDIRADIKRQNGSLRYDLNIPHLLALEPLLGRKLYGAMQLGGKVLQQHNLLYATGETVSLGGTIAFLLKHNRFTMDLHSVPLERLLSMLGYPQRFLGTAEGKAVYNTVSKKGNADLVLKNFQIKPSPLTQVLTAVLGKDPSRIIFHQTHYHADINGDHIQYTLQAKGTRSSIEITQGYIDTRTKAQKGRVKFYYEGKTLYGKISGTVDTPKFALDAGSTLKANYGNKLKKKLQEKVEKKWGKEAGALLKSFGL